MDTAGRYNLGWIWALYMILVHTNKESFPSLVSPAFAGFAEQIKYSYEYSDKEDQAPLQRPMGTARHGAGDDKTEIPEAFVRLLSTPEARRKPEDVFEIGNGLSRASFVQQLDFRTRFVRATRLTLQPTMYPADCLLLAYPLVAWKS